MLLILLNCSLVWGFVYSRVCYGGSFLTSYTHSPFHKAPHSLVDKLRLLRGLCPRSPRGSYGACISWAVSSRGILPRTPVEDSGLASQANPLLAQQAGRGCCEGLSAPSPFGACSLHTCSFRSSRNMCVAHCIGGFAPHAAKLHGFASQSVLRPRNRQSSK